MMRILLLFRNYPPEPGGIARMSYRLGQELGKVADVRILANKKGKRFLPIFLLYALACSSVIAWRDKAVAVHLGDVALAPLGVLLRHLLRTPVTVSAHGLDVIYPNRLYQWIIPRCLKRLDLIVANSRATRRECLKRVGAKPRCITILPGVDSSSHNISRVEARLRLVGEESAPRPLLLTVGRLVERKGVPWFVEEVLPKLNPQVVYVVLGDGPLRARIERLVSRLGLAERVLLLGHVSDDVLMTAYRAADVFIMPNVEVGGDIEGFGLVALEATAMGLPLVAARLQGIEDAVTHGSNGLLVRPGDAADFANTIDHVLSLPSHERSNLGARFQRLTLTQFGWDKTAAQYLEALRAVLAASRQGRIEGY